MSLIKLQEKMGVTADGSFGPATLKAGMKYFGLTPIRAAHFFGQIAHETGGFSVFTENLNYSGKGLIATFPKYFPSNLSELYARQPIKIASRVYANRMGNGDEASREGYVFRGRGALQTTGKSNYTLLANALKKPEIITNPDLVASDYAFESAKFFFDTNKLWTKCDLGVDDKTITAVTKVINGGTNGLEDRISLTKRYYKWLTE
jgi:putative chitinase